MTDRFALTRTVLLTAILAGCAGGANLAATTVLSYERCQGIDAGLTRVDFTEVAGIRGSTLLGASRGEEAPAAAPAPLLVAISRGRQPTPGYGLSLEGARRENATAVVTVRWETPESGSILPQVVTHPCLVVGLPANGLTRVEVLDRSGERLGSLTL